MGELLFLLGEDRLLFGSDYALWEPDWLVETVMNAELYDIDIEAKKEQFQSDGVTREFGLADHYGGADAAAD